MPTQGGQQGSSRKNPARSGKKVPSAASAPKARAQRKVASKQDPAPTGKTHSQKRGQIKSAEFIEDSDADGEKLPAESEERDDAASMQVLTCVCLDALAK